MEKTQLLKEFSHMPPVTQQDIQAFCVHCVAMRGIWNHRRALFDGPSPERQSLHRIAPLFFRDLDLLLIEHLILQICKITDPEESRGQTNLTLEFLVNHADFSEAPQEIVTLRQLRARMQGFREKILPQRNKLIGHLDRDAALKRPAWGGEAAADWAQFWRDLQDFLGILHAHFIDPRGGFDLDAAAGASDAEGLAAALEGSAARGAEPRQRGQNR